MGNDCSLVQQKKLLAANEASMSQVQKRLRTPNSSCDESQEILGNGVLDSVNL